MYPSEAKSKAVMFPISEFPSPNPAYPAMDPGRVMLAPILSDWGEVVEMLDDDGEVLDDWITEEE